MSLSAIHAESMNRAEERIGKMKQFTTLFLDGKKESIIRELAEDYTRTDQEKYLVNLYPQIRYQCIEGFGGAFTDAAGYVFSLMPGQLQKQFLEGYFSPGGLNYTFGRTSIDSCDFSRGMYAADDTPGDMELADFDMARPMRYVLPLVLQAQQIAGKPIRMMLTPWSPPAWTKSNGSRKGGGQLQKDYYPFWAEYICRYIREAEKAGMNVCFLSAQNEPKASQTWDSCLFTGAEEREFIRGYLYPALQRNGLSHVSMLIWDHNKERAFDRACETICDAEMEKIIGGVAVHWYSGDHFEALQMIHERFTLKLLSVNFNFLKLPFFRHWNASMEEKIAVHALIKSTLAEQEANMLLEFFGMNNGSFQSIHYFDFRIG